jgi:hypothetical protein
MIQRATRSGPDRQSHPSYGDQGSTGPLVKHIYSIMLTSRHVDVTAAPVMYARPKTFVFISKDQMKWIDANRWCRQGARDATIVPVEDITSGFSIDKRTDAAGMRREPHESSAAARLLLAIVGGMTILTFVASLELASRDRGNGVFVSRRGGADGVSHRERTVPAQAAERTGLGRDDLRYRHFVLDGQVIVVLAGDHHVVRSRVHSEKSAKPILR